MPLAVDEFKQRAEAAQLKPDELRKRMKERYTEQIELARKLRDPNNTNDNYQATNKAESE